jgi:hypothetical protein
LPGVVWMANSDMTNALGTTCRRLAEPLPGSGSSSQLRISRLLQRLLEFPF